MNYMNMVKFIHVSFKNAVASICFQEREELFNKDINQTNIVPNFVIIEAIFQTAGRIAREYSNNVYGGIIVSFNNFNFIRPVFTDEQLTINANLLSYNDKAKVFYLQVSLSGEENEKILPDGVVLIKQVKQITSDYLNNNMKFSIDENLKQIGYKQPIGS